MPCDCGMPSCAACLAQQLNNIKDLGIDLDKEEIYEYFDVEHEENMDDRIWEQVKEDYSPEEVDAVIKNPNEW